MSLLPATTLEVPWVALQGTIDQVCDPAETEAYVKQVKEGEIVVLPKVGHGFSVQENWMPQFKKAFSRIVGDERTSAPPPVDALNDLPLTEAPSSAAGPASFAVIVSGDGGWSFTEKALSSILTNHGIPVAALTSLRYFWSRRTPDGAAKDLERSAALSELPVLPEVEKLEGLRIFCFYGSDEESTLCRKLTPPRERHRTTRGSQNRAGCRIHSRNDSEEYGVKSLVRRSLLPRQEEIPAT